MSDTTLAIATHLRTPFTYKTPKGRTAHLPQIEKIKAVVVLIFFSVFALLPGPIAFYCYTHFLKTRRIQQLKQIVLKPNIPPLLLPKEENLSESSEARVFSSKARALPSRNWKEIATLLPALASTCQELDKLYTQGQTLLGQSRQSQKELAKRATIQETALVLKELKQGIGNLLHQLDQELITAENKVRTEGEKCKRGLKQFKNSTDSLFNQLAMLIEALPLHRDRLVEEVALLQLLEPSELQATRFKRILDLQFKRHSITGDGACGARSLACGIWQEELLEGRKTDSKAAQKLETQRALELRHAVADFIYENVLNFQTGDHNQNGTEAFDYIPFCVGLPAPGSANESKKVTIEEYLAALRNPRAYFGDIERAAAAHLYQRPIYIYHPGNLRVEGNELLPMGASITGADYEGEPILLFHNGSKYGGHYEIMTRK